MPDQADGSEFHAAALGDAGDQSRPLPEAPRGLMPSGFAVPLRTADIGNASASGSSRNLGAERGDAPPCDRRFPSANAPAKRASPVPAGGIRTRANQTTQERPKAMRPSMIGEGEVGVGGD